MARFNILAKFQTDGTQEAAGQVKELGREVKLTGEVASDAAKSIKELATQALELVGVGELMRKVAEATMAEQAAHAQLVSALQATRGASAQVAEAMEAQAAALSHVSTFSKDAIVQAEALA